MWCSTCSAPFLLPRMCAGSSIFPAWGVHTLHTKASASPSTAAAAYGGWMERLCAFVASYLQLCLFGIPAALLLGLMMEAEYSCIKLACSILGLLSPSLRLFALELPAYAFHKPWAAASLTELWGTRWHQFLRFYFEGLGSSLVDKLCGADVCNVDVSRRFRAGLRVVAAFVMSGFAHEYLVYAAFGKVSGTYMVFFGLHCLAVLMEGSAPHIPEHGLLSKRLALPPSMTGQPASTEGVVQRTQQHSGGGFCLDRKVGRSSHSNTGWLQHCWAWATCF
jgi:hypothetical protein